MKNLLNKLIAVQKEVSAILKSEENPYFQASYFDINGLLKELKPVLNKHGLVVNQPLDLKDGRAVIKTVVADVESGESLETYFPIPENPDPQKMGSAITYFRRYTLQSFFLLEAQDDDANAAADVLKDIKVETKPSMSGRGITVKQRDFILKLQGERGLPLSSEAELDKMTIASGKELIDKLLATPLPNLRQKVMQTVEQDMEPPIEYYENTN